MNKKELWYKALRYDSEFCFGEKFGVNLMCHFCNKRTTCMIFGIDIDCIKVGKLTIESSKQCYICEKCFTGEEDDKQD